MGNASNITLGTGTFSVNTVDVGYLGEKVEFNYKDEVKDIKQGIPRRSVLLIPLETECSLQAEWIETSPENMGYALGGLTPATIAGTEVDKTESFEILSFAANANNPGMESVKLGPTANRAQKVAITAESVVVKNSTEATTYTENDDYIVDYDTGYVFRNPGGAISTEESCKFKYSYTPVASKRIDLGKAYVQTYFELEFVHTNPTTLKTTTVHLWKAQASREFALAWDSQNEVKLNPKFIAMDDSDNHPDNPFGYILMEQ